MNYDFTLNNQTIKSFFEGQGNPPVSELMYLHEHPLLRPNFITEIEDMVKVSGEILEKKGLAGNNATFNKFAETAITIGSQLPKLTKTNAPIVLGAMKELYNICRKVNG